MRINSITVSGFKNLNTTRIELDKICALISPNNYGKSNLLEAIDFGLDFLHESRKGRKLMMGWVKGIPLNTALEDSRYEFEVEFEDVLLGEYKYVRYGFSFMWHRDDTTGDKIISEWIETRENTSTRYISYLKREEGRYRKNRMTKGYRKLELDDLQLAIDVLGLMEDIEIADVIKAIHKVSFRVCSSLDLRDRYQSSPLEYIQYDDEIVSFDDNDVPRALSKLKENAPEKYRRFEEAVYTLFPEFSAISLNEYILDDLNIEQMMTVTVSGKGLPKDEIPFKLRETVYRLFVKSDYLNQPMSIANMSTGTKRVIWLLANAFISNFASAGLIGIEEIETSIHPKMMRQLLEILAEALEGAPLIISSHSPYLIQYLKPRNIYIGIPNDRGVAEFRKIQRTKLRTLISNAREIELSVGEYLFELLSGDSEAFEILRGFLEVPGR